MVFTIYTIRTEDFYETNIHLELLKQAHKQCASKVWRRQLLTAFLLVNTEIGSESKVLKALKTIDNVEEAYLVYGVYDILAKITVQNMDELKEIITSRLLRSNEVKSSTTMIIIPQKQSLNTRTEEVFTSNV